jgi:hypothetical protein
MCHHDWEILDESNKETTFICVVCGEEETEVNSQSKPNIK